MKKNLNNEQMNTQNWRYKKKTPPIDEHASMNGPVKVTKAPVSYLKPIPVKNFYKPFVPGVPSPTNLSAFKCSKCDFVGKDRIDFNEHYRLEH